MNYITLRERPQLRTPTLIAAFGGWSDAAEAATTAAQVLVQRWRAHAFADIEPDEFYDFTETRPTVRSAGRTRRRIEWPANTFHYYTGAADGQDDYVVLIGIEPQLRWKVFIEAIMELCRELHVGTLVTLGALLDDTPHTRPTRVTGSSSHPEWQERLRWSGGQGKPYEGPTGILGVLSATCGQQGMRTLSLWGHVPYYLQGMANPRVALAILSRLDGLLGLSLDLQELERVAARFDAQVEEAIAQNPEAAEEVRRLEAGESAGDDEGEDDADDADTAAGSAEPISGEALIRDLEEFLRRRRGRGQPGEG